MINQVFTINQWSLYSCILPREGFIILSCEQGVVPLDLQSQFLVESDSSDLCWAVKLYSSLAWKKQQGVRSYAQCGCNVLAKFWGVAKKRISHNFGNRASPRKSLLPIDYGNKWFAWWSPIPKSHPKYTIPINFFWVNRDWVIRFLCDFWWFLSSGAKFTL